MLYKSSVKMRHVDNLICSKDVFILFMGQFRTKSLIATRVS